MKLAEALSIRITELLTEREMTAYKLSQLSGVSETTIGDLKKQRNTAVNLRIIYELTQGLGIDLAEFFNSPLFKGDNIVD
jgi:transcriptional regulator with XRE-family HTH domain